LFKRNFFNFKTLPNLIKRKHLKKGGKNEGTRTKVQASKQPKRGEPQGSKGTFKSSTNHMKHINLKKGS